jgi:hypothetical protein
MKNGSKRKKTRRNSMGFYTIKMAKLDFKTVIESFCSF